MEKYGQNYLFYQSLFFYTTEEIRSQSSDIADNADDVAGSIFRLSVVSGHITHVITSINSGINEITLSVQTLASLSVQNKENIENMNNEISKFSTESAKN
ncbi:MAG: hypothetical protein ACLFR1_11750 [Spirochaetia bacterium]